VEEVEEASLFIMMISLAVLLLPHVKVRFDAESISLLILITSTILL
jgi:hypothetical protein